MLETLFNLNEKSIEDRQKGERKKINTMIYYIYYFLFQKTRQIKNIHVLKIVNYLYL